MDDRTKSELYTKLLKSVKDKCEIKEQLDVSEYNNQIKLLKSDLVSNMSSNQEAALSLAKMFIEQNVHNIQNDVISILESDNIERRLKLSILDSVQVYLKDLIKSNNVTELALLYSVWKDHDAKKFSEFIQEACHNPKSSTSCEKFLFERLIPVIMDTKNTSDFKKVYLIELGLEFASYISVSKLSEEEYTKFLISVTDYIKNISELRDNKFNHWHHLWMFLVRLFGKKLHHSMSLINRLLRVVEHAFRNSTYEQRLRGYDCWKELIDNVSLDSVHLSSEKQIRLLLTPLRAKFSKQEAVIIKRFEVFVYLLEKLQDQGVLVLKEFLEFCFGQVGEDTDPNKAGQGKSLSGLWVRSAKVLLSVLGHCHEDNDECLESDEINLKSSIINPSNVSNICYPLINSITESCILLKNVELNQRKPIILKCFWTSLFNIILDPKVEKKQKCMDTLNKSFDRLLKDNDPYLVGQAVTIFRCSLKLEKEQVLCVALNNLSHILKIIFSVPLREDCCLEIEKFQVMLCSTETDDNRVKVRNNLLDSFTKYKTIESNADFVVYFWVYLTIELDDYTKEKSLDFLLWPALYTHQVRDPVKQVSIYENYKKIVTKYVEKCDDLHLGLFKNFEKILKNNPLLTKNILALVPMFSIKIENKEITNTTLEILMFILITPCTEEVANKVENVKNYLKKIYETNLSSISEQDTIKKLCTCLEHMLKLKHYDVLACLEKELQELPDTTKLLYAKFLPPDFLTGLLEAEKDTKTTNMILKVIDTLKSAKPLETKNSKPYMSLGGRSAKIAHLVKQIPPSPVKHTESPSTLRLFGKNIDTLTPLKVKGSLLKDFSDASKSTPTSSSPQQKPKALNIDDESTSKFVLIESEVKLDRDKLTEHQKETLKKRREDIPALYQDLSQSVSQSLDSNPTTLKPEENDDSFKKPKIFQVENEDVKENKACENINEEEIKEPVKQIGDDTEVDDDATFIETTENGSKADQKKAAVDAELKKLSMSIVGAEEFVSAPSRRKRRHKKIDDDNKAIDKEEDLPSKEEDNKIIAAVEEKINYVPLEDVVMNQADELMETEKVPENKNVETNLMDNSGIPKKRGRPFKKKSLKEHITAESSIDEKVAESEGNDYSITSTPETPDNTLKRKRGRPKSNKSIREDTTLKINEKEPLKLILTTNRSPETRRKKGTTRDLKSTPEVTYSVRKSQRKTVPNLKFTLSEQVKSSENVAATGEEICSTSAESKEVETNSDSSDYETTPLAYRVKTRNVEEKVKRSRSTKQNESRRGRKRKRVSSDNDSEDIIESSQDSSVNVSKLKRSSSRKFSTDMSPSKENQTTVEHEKSRKSHKSEDLFASTSRDHEVISKESSHKKRRSKRSDNSDSTKTTPESNAEDNRSRRIRPASLEETNAVPTAAEIEAQRLLEEKMRKARKHMVEAIERVVHYKMHRDTCEEETSKRTQSQDTQTQETESVDIGEDRIHLDLPQKPVLSENDKLNAEMETESLTLGSVSEFSGFKVNEIETSSEIQTSKNETEENETVVFDVEEAVPETDAVAEDEGESDAMEDQDLLDDTAEDDETLKTNIPSSPITGDTPSRTSELLHNTLDISPISAKSTPEKLSSDDEFVEQERKFVPVALKFDNEDTEHEKQKEKSPEKADDVPEKIDETDITKSETDERKVTSPLKDEAKTNRDTGGIADRATKLFDMVKSGPHRMLPKRRTIKSVSPAASRIKKMLSNVKVPLIEDVAKNPEEEDLLTFSREVPSPLALPRTSILKRKHSDLTDEGMSPCPKRKRVNFSDPCTTSKKIFLKEDVGQSSPLEANTDEEIDRQFLEILMANNIVETPQTEADYLETEEGLQVDNPLLLRNDRPIYPELVECDNNISIIARNLTGPMFIGPLLTKLKNKNITTVGNLASLSEAEITRFPFKSPIVTNVFKVLDRYYQNNFHGKFNKDKSEVNVNGTEESTDEETIPENVDTTRLKVDVQEEIEKIIIRAQSEGISDETLYTKIFSGIDQNKLLTYADSVGDQDRFQVLKSITIRLGFTKVLDVLKEFVKTPQEEVVYNEASSEQSQSLNNIIKIRGLEELQAAFLEGIKNGTYCKNELVNVCFKPLMNFIDISPVFDKLSVLEVGNLCVKRLKNEDWSDFVKHIFKELDDNTKVRNNIASCCDVDELSSALVSKASSEEISSCAMYLLSSTTINKDDLVKMFRLLTNSLVSTLPPSQLMELSIEFLKKIPLKE